MQIPDLSELIRLAQTPAGRQLIALLQKQGSSRLQQALASAASGDYTGIDIRPLWIYAENNEW